MIKELALVGVGVLLGKYCLKKTKHGKCTSCGCSKHGGKHSHGHHHNHEHEKLPLEDELKS